MSTPLECALRTLAAAVDPADEAQALMAAKIGGLLRGYDSRWLGADYEPLAVEQYVETELVNPVSMRRSRTFRIGGKLDAVCRHRGQRVLMDHKTTSSDIADPHAPYWRQLVVEGQASHYMLLEWLSARKLDTAVWDVVRKPSIKPKKLTKSEAAHCLASRTYCGFDLAVPEMERLQRDFSESLGMYELRLAQDCSIERPEWYFQRRGVPRLDAELREYAVELWEHGQEMLHARATNRWARNSGACLMYGAPCKFLGICSGHDTSDSEHWRRKANVHAELPMLQGNGRNIITTSRVRCFQTCRRKHWFQYELGIERMDEEERESLLFGHLWHLALEAWFLAQMGDSDYEHDEDTTIAGANGDDAGQAPQSQ